MKPTQHTQHTVRISRDQYNAMLSDHIALAAYMRGVHIWFLSGVTWMGSADDAIIILKAIK